MLLSLRWYGPSDAVGLEKIRQIPGVAGVVTDLSDIPVGEVWPEQRLLNTKETIEDAGLKFTAIESIPVHEDIKTGSPDRDKYITNYAESLRNVGQAGIEVVTYNFMPVFDWYRSDLAMRCLDGSNCLAYREAEVADQNPLAIGELEMPAWAGEFSTHRISQLFKVYEEIERERLWDNLAYFLKAVVPVADQCGVKLALHPDDPPWPVFGLPRIITDENALARVLAIVDSPANGLALCSGSLGAGRENDLPRMIRRFRDRVHFAHVRNVSHDGPERDFHEVPHPSGYGSLDIYEIMKAYSEVGFSGVLRPDHGRMIWGETGKPGYGLYDRALGATYLLGLWEAISKNNNACPV